MRRIHLSPGKLMVPTFAHIVWWALWANWAVTIWLVLR